MYLETDILYRNSKRGS